MNSTLNKYLGMIERYFCLDGYFVFECSIDYIIINLFSQAYFYASVLFISLFSKLVSLLFLNIYFNVLDVTLSIMLYGQISPISMIRISISMIVFLL